ncbi:hypothetical protein ACFV2X_21890 [Streptomyces sp. NPDC059679]|uniref:hypothetical protein n=1 Tax=Streptomyces sp. NPDC059679 TaxID=3346903 RepID=UPI0036B74AE8
MNEALIGLAGVFLGLGGSMWTTIWANRQHRKALTDERLTNRQEEAAYEIRKALISVHHLKHTLSDHEESGGPEELRQLIHTIDTYSMVLTSAELRSRLTGATQIMWYWHVLMGTEGHPVWLAVNDATECVGAHLRGEPLPQEPPIVRNLREEAKDLEEHE